jgi:hypothetical protein
MGTSSGNAFRSLQQWYLSQCNGDWEHSFGVKIDTLDNPGWILTIDLAETELAGLCVPRARMERTETDWAQHEVVDDKFVACGGPLNLEELVERFLALAVRGSAS